MVDTHLKIFMLLLKVVTDVNAYLFQNSNLTVVTGVDAHVFRNQNLIVVTDVGAHLFWNFDEFKCVENTIDGESKSNTYNKCSF